ncbi:putative EKC/KEOPS complex subunit bud32 [Blattamonas nauphoetae]|uniref:non-specific serine/threonine protein kinase n=1 Tax=Blattamonas nauphoetae TaxID=2049346 RepID=A0ABQ9YC78_9EUKA|nr:putative EKC/KEOPS complex subunit bud32 [Blattamonas nauphoetae]
MSLSLKRSPIMEETAYPNVGTILGQGAEAIITVVAFNEGIAVKKVRPAKTYRLPQLDTKLRKSRTNQEYKCIQRAEKAGILVPKIYHISKPESSLTMEFIHGKAIRKVLIEYQHDYISQHPSIIQTSKQSTLAPQPADPYELTPTEPQNDEPDIQVDDNQFSTAQSSDDVQHPLPNTPPLQTEDEDIVHSRLVIALDDQIKHIAEELGTILAKLHDANVIHGDLTTSNMILTPSNQICLIDFGLSYASADIEDKAVDLHLLRRACTSTHPALLSFYDLTLQTYASKSVNSTSVLKRLEVVELRGRKRSMAG